ncbi:MAG: MlaD family protein [Pseudomonadota bacterium]
METRANYVLIGAFAVAGFIGILLFFLWFARVEFDQQFAYYDIDFTSVSGLSEASDVRFAGLPVGQVVDVRLSPEADGRVRVRIEVERDTPVRTDSEATIESLGVTGVSFVGLNAGSTDAPLLTVASDDTVPMIPAGQSVFQSLTEDAPAVVEETLGVVRELRALLGEGNQERVQTILENLEESSAAFAQALEDFSDVSGTVSAFASEIDQFNDTLTALTSDVSGVLQAAQSTLTAVEALSKDAQGLVAEGTKTLADAQAPIAAVNAYVTEDLKTATTQLTTTVAAIEARIDALGTRAEALMATYATTGTTATSRLSEAQATIEATNALIARMDEALVSVNTAAQSLDGLIETGATPLVSELRAATTQATAVITATEKDLPAILADIRKATTDATTAVSAVAQDLSAASGQIDGLTTTATATLATAQTTFANANTTLTAINGALERGDAALVAAEKAFSGADRVINEDVSAITTRLSATLEELDKAVQSVAAEIPEVTTELRSASRSAQSAFAQIEGAVGETSPAVRAFATDALPQFGRLAQETRALIENLDALTQQLQRNPSRLFLDPGAPEYRR